MVTIWVLVVVCMKAACGPSHGEIKGFYATLEECTRLAKHEEYLARRRQKAICVHGLVEKEK